VVRRRRRSPYLTTRDKLVRFDVQLRRTLANFTCGKKKKRKKGGRGKEEKKNRRRGKKERDHSTRDRSCRRCRLFRLTCSSLLKEKKRERRGGGAGGKSKSVLGESVMYRYFLVRRNAMPFGGKKRGGRGGKVSGGTSVPVH